MIIEELTNFIINTNFKNIPEECIKTAKLCFVDYLGVTRRGIKENTSKITLKTLKEFNMDFNSQTSIIGIEDKYLNEINTAYINGISSHVLDLDDGHRFAQIHPSGLVFSTALALSQKYDLNCKKFLESVIIGYDIAVNLGILVNPNHRNQGFHTSGTIGTFVVGAVASKLLNLNKKEIINTLGICGTQSAGLLESDHSGSMAKTLHIGHSIYSGIMSAYLAKNGFTGAESIIDGKEGFINAMSFETIINDKLLSIFKKNLKKHHIGEVYHKTYPFCRHLHSSIDSSLNINKFLSKNNIALNQIKKIKISTYKIASEHNNFKPTNMQELKQSLPLSVAITLLYKNIDLTLVEKIIKQGLFDYNDMDLNILLEKITIIENKEFTDEFPYKRPSNIILSLNSNENLEFLTEIPKGEKENPLTINDIIEKFNNLNPEYNTDKLKIIKNMEKYKIREIINEVN